MSGIRSWYRSIPTSVKVLGAAGAIGWMISARNKNQTNPKPVPIQQQQDTTTAVTAVAATPTASATVAPVAYAQPKGAVEPVPQSSGPVAALESVGQTLKSGRQDAAVSNVIAPQTIVPHSGGGEAVEIGSFRAGGIMFKDKVKVVAINDPAVSGVTCHVSYVERALNPFSDPSGSSCSCIRTADTIRFHRPIKTSPNGEAVFSQNKNWLFKSLKVRRVYDPTTHSLVYISYSDRLITDNENRGDRFKTSVSNVRLKRNEQVSSRAGGAGDVTDADD